MATYITSDIHGQYDKFKALMEKINLKDEDTLYVLGDIIDRGPEPIKTMLEIMEMPNAVCIKGNHEVMALDCLEFFNNEDPERSTQSNDEGLLGKILLWQRNGRTSTVDGLGKLSEEQKQSVIKFMRDMPLYQKITVSDKDYLLVHGGLGGFYPGRQMEEYSINELVWERPDYNKEYFPDVYVVTGHTPTQIISGNSRPGYIFKANNHIAIDCGSYWPDGRLSAIRLDDLQEFYSDN